MSTVSHSRTSAVLLLFAMLMLTVAGTYGCASNIRHQSRLADEQEQFWAALESMCGQAFEGRVVTDTTGNPDFQRSPIIMHVRRCEPGRIMVPFHVADDRSRTWIITRTQHGLRLKHDHRHEDGTEDDLTQYGGDTTHRGSATRQEFHADAHTAALLPEAATNVWTIDLEPGFQYAYALRREGTTRRFRVEFDLTRPVTPPPAPWGHE